MNDVQKILLSVLSNCLYNERIKSIASINSETLEKLLEEAYQQGVYSLVFQSTKEMLRREFLPALYQEYEQASMRQLYQTTNNDCYHRKIHSLMTENGIPYAIIKGQASGAYYARPELRKYGDIDFLVDKENIEKAGELLEGIGMVKTRDREHKCHIAYRDGDYTIEMHWEPGGIPNNKMGDRCRWFLKDIFDTEKEYKGMLIPDDFHHGIILLLHTAVHMINTGIGIRHLCDWAVFVEKVDVSKFEPQLRQIGLWRFAQIMTQAAARYLGCPEQSWAMVDVDESLLNEIIEDFLAAGEFGRKDSERINEAKIMTTSAQGNIGQNSFLQLFRMLTEKAYKAMPICKSVPVLIPAGWVFVSIRHLLRIEKGMRPPIHIRRMIENADKRREIYMKFELFE